MSGYLVLGAGFGMIMHANGYGILWAVAMSFFIYAGSMQYAAVGLLTGGASFLTVALTTFAVNARHIFYGIAIAIISGVTILLRVLPFVLFSGRRTPKIIIYLGKVLPYAVMGMLVVYCLKDISFSSIGNFLPALIGVIAVAVSYIIKRNTLLSIIVGTVLYMVLVQFVF